MRTVYVVPHTHWDREWYQPFELFRWRLVRMVDELIDHMEAHPEYRRFNLDGQSIVIQDYLDLRPENADRLRRLVESGRVLIGPWWVQPDEFLPSAESHVRSLQRGIRFAERLGGSLTVGHCADQFGHIAQMPQIMAGFGLTSACLWRGVPDTVPGWSFRWRAPDGTEIPVLYLRQSYSNGWRLPAEPDRLLARVREAERGRRDHEPALLMNGTDHSRMEAHVPAAITAADLPGYDLRVASLLEYERAMAAAGIDDCLLTGELRSPDNSNVLVGVLSARMNIKQRDFAVDAWLTRYAEPLDLLAWLHGGPDGLPALRRAWSLALENTPHDSICGCSVDQTHREMLPRYDGAEQLAREVARGAAAYLASRMASPPGGSLAVFRPVAHAPAVLEVEVPAVWDGEGIALADGPAAPAHLGPPGEAEILAQVMTTPAGGVRHLDFLRDGRYDTHAIEAVSAAVHGGELSIHTVVGDAVNTVDDRPARALAARAADDPAVTAAHVLVTRSPRRTLRAVLPAASSVGIENWTPAGTPGIVPGTRAGRRSIRTSRFAARLAKDGRLSITDRDTGLVLENACAFVSEGDRGDEYNADILADAVIAPKSVQVLATEAHAAGATLLYRLVLSVPARLARSRRARVRRALVDLPVNVEVRLWEGLPRVDFRATLVNTAEDHRLRVLFPLPFAVDHAVTENQFHVATRPLDPPAWNGTGAELPPTTFPQKTFAAFDSADVGRGLAVFNRGLPEGEIVRDPEGRQAYALTLLRCVGWLSRNDLVTRRGGAGPMTRTPEAQMPGTHTFEYAISPYRGTWETAGILPLAHAYAYPPIAWVTNEHGGDLGPRLPLATIEDPAVAVSALHRSDADGDPVARVFNASAAPRRASLVVPAAGPGASRVDLLERHVAGVDLAGGGWAFDLRPWEIASLRFGRA